MLHLHLVTTDTALPSINVFFLFSLFSYLSYVNVRCKWGKTRAILHAARLRTITTLWHERSTWLAVFTLIKPHAGAARAEMQSWNILEFKSSWRRAVTEMIMFYGQLPLRYIYTLSWCCVFNLIDNHSLNYIKLLWYWFRFNSVLQRETLIVDNLGRSHLSVCFWALWQHNQTTLYSRKTFSLWQLRSIQRPGNPAHIHFPMGVGQILTGWRLLNPVFNYLWGNPLLHWCNTEKWI